MGGGRRSLGIWRRYRNTHPERCYMRDATLHDITKIKPNYLDSAASAGQLRADIGHRCRRF